MHHSAQQPKFYYLFTYFHRTGGDYVNLDHVRTLRRFGTDARVLFLGEDEDLFRRSVNGVPVVSWEQAAAGALLPEDILVAPEVYRFAFDGSLNLANRVVMHNQNALQTWQCFDSANDLNACPALHSVVVPSRYTEFKLRETGVSKPVSVVYPYVPDDFYPREKRRDTVKIVFSARKRRAEVPIVWFYFRSLYRGGVPVEWVNLEGLTRRQVAEEMGTAAIFASFAEREAMGLMVLEAMASGCHIVGFSGYTDRQHADFAGEELGDWINEGEYRLFAEYLCDAVARFAAGTDNPKTAAAAQTVAQRFRRQHFERDLYAWAAALLAQSA